MTVVTPSPLTLQEFDTGIGQDPLRFMERLRDLGRVVAFPLQSGRTLYVSNDPGLSMAALAHGERTHRGLLRELVGPGLFVVASGEHWQTRRSLVRPLFSTHARANYHTTVLAAAEDFVQRALVPRAGQGIELAPLMQQMSVEIILRLTLPELSAPERDHLTKALLAAVEFLDRRLFDPELVKEGELSTFLEDRSVLTEAIERRAAAEEPGEGIVTKLKERIDHHSEWTGDEKADALREEVMSIFVAGVETMGALFTWVLWNLAAHPDQENLCRTEAGSAAFDGLASEPTFPRDGFPHLQENVQETLRLTPPAWALFRRMPKEIQVGDLTLQAGDQVLAATWSTHRSPELWDGPEVYRPSRFRDVTIPQGQFFPFGAGPHQCLGKDLSLMEAQLAIGCILRAGRIILTGDPTSHRLKPAIALHLDPSPTARFTPVDSRRSGRGEELA